jgi:endonuclease/exonuclease/phosphatase family metal-dependent hydrolase
MTSEYRRMAERELRVVQLNADSLVGPRWSERRHEIVAWLDELTPDVVCLQEIWQDDRHCNTGGWIADHDAPIFRTVGSEA